MSFLASIARMAVIAASLGASAADARQGGNPGWEDAAGSAVFGAPERGPEGVPGGFDDRSLTGAERQIIEIALAAEGEDPGTVDGIWSAESQIALETYAIREFGSRPGDVHVAALVLGLLADIDIMGWRHQALPGLGAAIAVPEVLLDGPEEEDGGLRWWSEDGAFTMLTHAFDTDMARAWHRAARSAGAGVDVETEETPQRLFTAGMLEDGRQFRTISLKTGEAWATVFLAGPAGMDATLRFMTATFSAGPASPWEMPIDGRLGRLVAGALAAVDGNPTAGPGLSGLLLPPDPASLTPPERIEASGTGFYVGRNLLVTASHVVAGCRSVALADGTPLDLLASDGERDIAVLASDRPAESWLALSRDGRGRLGQRLHAIGYPYYNIAGTSLHLTSGNVSSLADVNDDTRFFSFSAPVQPGNSGGPILDANGTVIGVVVSRLSEHYIAEATGTLPQNINYGLKISEISEFLRQNRINPAREGLGPFTVEGGAPEGIEGAIVPVLCN